MTLSIEKCSTFEYVAKNKTWFLWDLKLVIRNVKVPYNKPDEVFKYLGAKVTPWSGLVEGSEVSIIRGVIDRVRGLTIKPMQKLELLRKYILPRYTYGLIARPPPRGCLKEIDTLVRQGAKRILHLHETTSSPFLYTPQKQGGRGLLEIERMVLVATLRNYIKSSQSSDHLTSGLVHNPKTDKKCREYATALGLQWPLTLKQLDEYKAKNKKSYQLEWASQQVQGQGCDDFAHQPISNAWIRRHDLLTSSRIIDAFKMRTNTYPTRMAMRRAHPDINPTCRACGDGDETLGHILGKCRTTKPKRIHRHDEIVELIRRRMATKFQTLVEPQLEVNGERLKPDLVVNANEEGVLVLDVTVRYENADSLSQAAREKIAKYTPLLPVVRERFKSRKARVVPIVVGSRGALPPSTTRALADMRIKKKDWLTMSMIALRSSIEILNAFMDG